MGSGAHIQMVSAQSTGAPDPAADAAAQRDKSLEHDAQNRLAELFTTRVLMASKTVSEVLALSVGLHSYGLGVRGGHERHGALKKGRSKWK